MRINSLVQKMAEELEDAGFHVGDATGALLSRHRNMDAYWFTARKYECIILALFESEFLKYANEDKFVEYVLDNSKVSATTSRATVNMGATRKEFTKVIEKTFGSPHKKESSRDFFNRKMGW